jgi:hypothetical protein
MELVRTISKILGFTFFHIARSMKHEVAVKKFK